LLNGSFGGLAVADFDGGLLVLGDVDGGHCNSRSSCLGWWEWWIGSAESALMENQQNKNLKVLEKATRSPSIYSFVPVRAIGSGGMLMT
jgi:hypothetical protein